ncbi:MAG: competence/damage-inducible protein A [Planctomycetota bacterium]|nr:MAG: competence/damage-inducible protein A [Planctomycetota bacterium]
MRFWRAVGSTRQGNSMELRAEIIAVGDELVSGQRLDTNSQWLSRALADAGGRVVRHTTVGDDLQANIDALRSAAARVDLIVCTGGLGPTQDDLTREAIAAAFDAPLELHQPSLEHIQSLFARRGRSMPPRNRLQAMLPRGSLPIDNPHGSAPGIDLSTTVDGRSVRIVALPGVPAEMREMWSCTVGPKILPQLLSSNLRQFFHVVKVFGIGESDVEARLPGLFERGRDPTVGITVSRATITLRIASWARDETEFRQKAAATLQQIHQALGDLVFGCGEMELEDRVAADLVRVGWRMVALEIGASSWVGDWLQAATGRLEVPTLEGGRSPFAGSLAFARRADAVSWLRTDRDEADSAVLPTPSATAAAEPQTQVSELVELAELAAKRFAADVALVIDGYPSEREMVAATSPFPVRYALWVGGGQVVDQRQLGGHPDVLGPRIAKVGLDLVRRAITDRHPTMV